MRIIGGKYRSKKLFSPQSEAVRPTSDRAREALFNILRSKLGSDFSNLKLIDIFAGSGAFALEAVSQGFGKVCLVEIDLSSAAKNAAMFVAEKNKITLLQDDATKLFKVGDVFDVLFMDAPYNKGLSEKSLLAAAERKILNKNALCLIEVEKNESCNLPSQYELLETRNYGIAKILLARFMG